MRIGVSSGSSMRRPTRDFTPTRTSASRGRETPPRSARSGNLCAWPGPLNACPMVHGTGLFTFLLSVSCGAPMVMVERFDPDAVLDRIELHGCTWMLGLPFMDNTVGADHGHSEQDVLTKRIEQDNSRLDRLIDICPSC